jgi:hypothetical protein
LEGAEDVIWRKGEKKPARENGKFLQMVFGDSTIIMMAKIHLQAELQRTALLIEITADPTTPIRKECHTMPVTR